jgi:hypothetical protein
MPVQSTSRGARRRRAFLLGAAVAGLIGGAVGVPASGAAAAPAVAFPGAVGYGAAATGGAGGTTYHVTNLNDSGSGSFRDAVSASNRIVVFDVAGYVKLASAVSVKSNITIDGTTAPGQGVGFMAREVSFSNSTNVVVRNLRFREGTLDPADGKASIALANSSNMIFDHVSVEFAKWDDIDAVGASNITWQESIIADPIGQQFSAHTEGGPFTWYHDVFVNAHNRNPLAKGNTQYVGNVVYDYQAGYTAGNSSGHFTHDVVDNYFVTGPRTTKASNAYYQMGNQTTYNSGNILDSNRDGVLNGSTLALGGGSAALSAPWSSLTAGLVSSAGSAAAAYAHDIAQAGALPRDQVDTLVIADVTSLGTAGDLWTSQTATGLDNDGYGTLSGSSTGGTPGSLTPGSRISLQATTACCTADYVRHGDSDNNIVLSPVTSSSTATEKGDATWIVRAGLGNSACVSFESGNKPGHYLRHLTYQLQLATSDGTAAFPQDATFCPQTGHNGQGYSFQAADATDRYLRHYDYTVYAASNGGPNTYDSATLWNDDTSWNVAAAWS